MNENQFAKQLENEYLEAKKEYGHFTINTTLEHIEKDLKLNFNTLKHEVKNLGYHLSLAKDINIKYWQREWEKTHMILFYKDLNDL